MCLKLHEIISKGPRGQVPWSNLTRRDRSLGQMKPENEPSFLTRRDRSLGQMKPEN